MIVRSLRIVCDHAGCERFYQRLTDENCPGHGKDAEADLAVYVPPST